MKIEDLKRVGELNRNLANCDFHLGTLRFGSSSISITTKRGGVVGDYGNRTEYVTQDFIDRTHASLVLEIEARRAEHVAELRSLGVIVEASA